VEDHGWTVVQAGDLLSRNLGQEDSVDRKEKKMKVGAILTGQVTRKTPLKTSKGGSNSNRKTPVTLAPRPKSASAGVGYHSAERDGTVRVKRDGRMWRQESGGRSAVKKLTKSSPRPKIGFSKVALR